jgi:Domain of unknown function (DUF4926)
VEVRELNLLDVVRLRSDLPELGLTRGMVGAVVDLLRGDGTAYEVEFVDANGATLFVGAVAADELERVSQQA